MIGGRKSPPCIKNDVQGGWRSSTTSHELCAMVLKEDVNNFSNTEFHAIPICSKFCQSRQISQLVVEVVEDYDRLVHLNRMFGQDYKIHQFFWHEVSWVPFNQIT